MSEENDFKWEGNPEMLAWARMNQGMDRAYAAAELGTDEVTLMDYETGKSTPMISFIGKCAKLYRRPLAAFLLPKPPKQERGYPTAIIIEYSDGRVERYPLGEEE
ncbi:helix-turn-helix domain-containing protein [bacterium]|nr:helix-turn-helix domain-containing protein [bacterium]